MKSLSLIGMSKNAGKTTVLNALLQYYSNDGTILGLTSVGLDGEDRDTVTHTNKPRIYVATGTLFATAVSLLALCDATKEIIMVTGINTPLGEVIIARARTDGYVQLAGPSINVQVAHMCETLHKFGAETVIVDGAFSRKALASPAVTENTILCAGASLDKDMCRVIDETRHVHDLLKSEKISLALSQFTARFPLSAVNEDGSVIGFEQAALTDALANDLLKQGLRNALIIAEDASKLLINAETGSKLALRNIKIQVRNRTNLIAVTINPVSAYGYEFHADDFKNALVAAIKTPVINVVDEGAMLYDLLA